MQTQFNINAFYQRGMTDAPTTELFINASHYFHQLNKDPATLGFKAVEDRMIDVLDLPVHWDHIAALSLKDYKLEIDRPINTIGELLHAFRNDTFDYKKLSYYFIGAGNYGNTNFREWQTGSLLARLIVDIEGLEDFGIILLQKVRMTYVYLNNPLPLYEPVVKTVVLKTNPL